MSKKEYSTKTLFELVFAADSIVDSEKKEYYATAKIIRVISRITRVPVDGVLGGCFLDIPISEDEIESLVDEINILSQVVTENKPDTLPV